ncbi:venom serine carboxypeptidase-like [Pectinophora gossypiella]|nr:venom serine carboxypeptidase-like [Pectinophora gossypiella]
MSKSVIYLLFLLAASARGRVATIDDTLPDVSANAIKDEIKPIRNASEVHIVDLPTVTPRIEETTENANLNVTCGDVKENSVDSDLSEACSVLPSNDNGTALILTPYIKENRLEEARNACRVSNQDLFLGVDSYSGFFTVNETLESNMFFWYFPVENKPVNETPWIVWLQGGPGASSMTGLFDEIGPFHVTFDGTLIRNKYSWLENHSLLFIDNPVGTGYSYTNSPEGYAQDMETYGDHLHLVLKQFLRVFPELRSAPLFVAGESYAGKYVPALAVRLHRDKHLPGENVNLRGLIAGNAYVDPAMISQMERPFYYFGLMESEQIDIVKPLIQAFQDDIAAHRSAEAKDKWNHLITVLLVITQQKHAYNFLRDDLPVGKYIMFLQKPEVKRALHVGDIKFSFVNMTVNAKLNGDFLSSAKGLYEELLNHYRVLTYCGQLDQMLSCVLTSENYRTWHWNGQKEFLDATRYPFVFNGKLSGYHKSGGQLTEVVIRGAGHMAPMDAPAPTQTLVARWTHAQSLGRVSLLEGSFLTEYVRNNSIVHYL